MEQAQPRIIVDPATGENTTFAEAEQWRLEDLTLRCLDLAREAAAEAQNASRVPDRKNKDGHRVGTTPFDRSMATFTKSIWTYQITDRIRIKSENRDRVQRTRTLLQEAQTLTRTVRAQSRSPEPAPTEQPNNRPMPLSSAPALAKVAPPTNVSAPSLTVDVADDKRVTKANAADAVMTVNRVTLGKTDGSSTNSNFTDPTRGDRVINGENDPP